METEAPRRWLRAQPVGFFHPAWSSCVGRLPLLEAQAFIKWFLFGGRLDSPQELGFPMIVEFPDHFFTPGFTEWDEPGFDVMMQTESDRVAHPTGMGPAAVEDHFVIDLLVFWPALRRLGCTAHRPLVRSTLLWL
jgi:hypothetical protein